MEREGGNGDTMPVLINRKHHPLVIATAYGVLTDDEYAAHLEECADATLARDTPYAYVYDGVGLDKMAPTTRRLQADWINKHSVAIKKLNVGCGFAFVGLNRPLLTAVHWMSPPPYPYKIFGARRDATRWCIEQLRSAGLEVPDADGALSSFEVPGLDALKRAS